MTRVIHLKLLSAVLLIVPPITAQPPAPADDEELPVVAKLRAIVKAKPLEPAKEDDDLRKLLKERYNAAVRGLQSRLREFDAGRGTVEKLFLVYRNVHDSRLELSRKPAEEIEARELYLELAKAVEQVAEARLQATGDGPLEDARYVRLDAEIQLLKAKRQAKQPK